MAPIRTVKVTDSHPDGYKVINWDTYEANPEDYTLMDEEGAGSEGGSTELPSDPETPDPEPEEDFFYIVGNVAGVKNYWNGDEFQLKPSEKLYTSRETAERAIESTKAIQSQISLGLVLKVRVEIA